MVAVLRCVQPQFQWYQLAYATEMKSIQLHDSIEGLSQKIVSITLHYNGALLTAGRVLRRPNVRSTDNNGPGLTSNLPVIRSSRMLRLDWVWWRQFENLYGKMSSGEVERKIGEICDYELYEFDTGKVRKNGKNNKIPRRMTVWGRSESRTKWRSCADEEHDRARMMRIMIRREWWTERE